MRPSRIRSKLVKNEPALITTLHFIDPSLYEMTSLLGFDGIWLDLEHHGTSVETAATLMRAARVGASDIVARPAKGEFLRMSRLLEMGAQAIMYPRCDSADEAREVVRWAKFSPLGTRGYDGGNVDSDYCAIPMKEYVEHANRETLVIIQLESPEAVANADKIAAIDGVDALMLGPSDFSLLAGIPEQFDHRRLAEATEAVARAAEQAKKPWGMPVGSTEKAKKLLDRGARLIFHNADIVIVKNALEAMQRDFAPLGFTFENRLGK